MSKLADKLFLNVMRNETKIVEYDTFWSCLESLDFSKSDVSDCHVINDMIEKGCEFSFFETKEWHDIGNTSELVSARKHFSSDHNVLDKDDESIFLFKQSIWGGEYPDLLLFH